MTSDISSSLCIVMTACGNRAAAKQIATRLVEERAAACINLLPIYSVYRWQGEVQSEDEWLLLIKTRAETVSQMRDRIKALHPYEVPEILVLPVQDADADYLAWLMDNTDPPP